MKREIRSPSDSSLPTRRGVLVCTAMVLVALSPCVCAASHSDGPDAVNAPPGESFPVLHHDAAWTWFGGARAVSHEGRHRRTYAGWITSNGDVMVGSIDRDNGDVVVRTVWPDQDPDDHSNPSVLVLPDGRIAVFCSPHRWRKTTGRREQQEGGIFYRVSTRPEDVSEWGEPRMLRDNVSGGFGWTYPKPFQLAGEDERIYLLWRGGNGCPVLAFSDDVESWNVAGVFVDTEGLRPYLLVASDDVDEMHIAFTTGHPEESAGNAIHYVKYRDGTLYRADGSEVADVASIPVSAEACDTVYDGVSSGDGWLWDIAFDDDGNPVIAYVVFPDLDDHRYRYARWSDGEWTTTELVGAGTSFPRHGFGVRREHYYSGGIALDHADPNVVYLSRPVDGVFELERWETQDEGETWTRESLTAGSVLDNVRPVVPMHRSDGDPELMWMSGVYYRYDLFGTAIRYMPAADSEPAETEPRNAEPSK